MSDYCVKIYDENDSAIGEIANWFTLSYSRKLNDYGQAVITFSGDDPLVIPLLAMRRYQVKIYRDNSLVWAGEQVSRRGQLAVNSENRITLTCNEYLEQLAFRFTNSYRRFDAVDAGDVAWTLIDESQNLTYGDYGITEGTIEVTKDRDRTYENKNVLQAIKQLSEVIDGFDFELTPEKVFNVYDQKGIDRTATTVFEYGTNIQSMNIEESFANPINSAIVVGEDNRVERTNATSAGIYALRQTLINAMGVTDDATLNDKGDAIVGKYRSPLLSISFSQVENTRPFFGALSLGDIVKIRVSRSIYTINNNFRIYGTDVKIGRDNQEKISYTVGLI